MNTGTAFYRFLTGLDPDFGPGKGFSVIYPYSDIEVKRVLKIFCQRFYSDTKSRTLILGINPGRFGAGITGIPFTDPEALSQRCGIRHHLQARRELSSTFVYDFIDRFGGPSIFYKHYLISSVMPMGLLFGTKNCNYYDSATLFRKCKPVIELSMKKHLEMHVNSERLIILGKKNADFFASIKGFKGLFKEVVVLEHPRYVMQYQLKNKDRFIDQWLSVLK